MGTRDDGIAIHPTGRHRLGRVTEIISRVTEPEHRRRGTLVVIIAAIVVIAVLLAAGFGAWRGTSQPSLTEW